MAAKKETDGKKSFIVRTGFVVELVTESKDTAGNVTRSTKTVDGGETISLTYEQYLAHAHKLEFADQKDIEAALADEAERAKAKVVADPMTAFSTLLTALVAHAQTTGTLPNLMPDAAPADTGGDD